MKNRPVRHLFVPLPVLLWALLASIVALSGARQGLSAEPTAVEPTEPIQITADRLVADTKTDTAQFSGSVRAVQGDTEIKADQLTLYYQSDSGSSVDDGPEAIKQIKAQGHVRISFDNRLAVSEQAVYIMAERKLILEGHGSKIISGQDEIIGSKITFYRDDGRVAMEGDEKNPVKAILHTNQRGLN